MRVPPVTALEWSGPLRCSSLLVHFKPLCAEVEDQAEVMDDRVLRRALGALPSGERQVIVAWSVPLSHESVCGRAFDDLNLRDAENVRLVASSQSADASLYHLETRPREDPGAARTLLGDDVAGCSNKAAGATLRAVASTRSASKVGFAAPVSRRDMYVRKKPVWSANSSCVMPRATRNSLMRRPKAMRGVRRFTAQCCFAYTNSYTHESGHLYLLHRVRSTQLGRDDVGGWRRSK